MVEAKTDLQRFLDAKKKPSRLLGDIERHLLAQPMGDRSTTVLHPSEMTKFDWCLRESWFLLQGVPKKQVKPAFKLQSIFDTGHALHSKWQRYFQDMGVLHGRFKCAVCDGITFATSPQKCADCGAPWYKLTYDEVTLFDNDLRIKGHTDGWIKGLGKDALIEIKTVGPGTLRFEAGHLMREADGDFLKAFQLVKTPFSPHILQGQIYLELMKRMGNPVDEIVFIYELKADQSMKEFTVQADFELVRHIFENAERVVQAIEAGEEVACSNSKSGSCPTCSKYKKEDIPNAGNIDSGSEES
jgi:CRISPR/Cas system-associated exonuclease Cas4 (RecB family)